MAAGGECEQRVRRVHHAAAPAGHAAPAGRTLRATANCFVRAIPDPSGEALRLLRRGDALPGGGATTADGWHAALYWGRIAWVSGRFARVER